MGEYKLYPYQEEGVRFLKARRHALLAHDMGLGKSCMAIVAATELGLKNVLIICPASVKYNWRNEIQKWAPGTPVDIIDGCKPLVGPSQKPYTVVNYDLIHSKPIFLQLIQRRYDLLVCDEAHYLKNFSAKRTKCVYYPKGLKDRADRVWLLTGTPVLNRPVELYPHFKALVPEILGPYSSYRRYADRYCAAYENKWGLDVSGASNLGELSQKLEGFMLRRLKKDVLKELPDKTYQTILLPSTKTQQAMARKERMGYEQNKESVLGELASLRRQSGLAKIPQAVAHIENVLEEKDKLVIFAYHKDVIRGLCDALRRYGPVTLTGDTPSNQRYARVRQFVNDPACRVFIGQIEAAGTGIDGLQEAADTVIFAELTWVPGQIHQAIDRCHRIGQKNPVLVQFLTVPGSIDEDIAETIARKEAIITKVVKPTEKEEQEMPTEKRISVTVTVEVDAVTVPDAIVAVGRGMESKGAEIVKVHGAQAVVLPSGIALSPMRVPAPAAEAPATEAPAPVKRTRKAKETPAPAEDADFGSGPAEQAEEQMDGPGLMRYCNSVLAAVSDAAKKTAVIKEVAKLFREQFGVVAIKELPTDKVAAAKDAFDKIVKKGA